ncbi:hypothetical protein [Prauserella aidingensis]|uniref:hypothetical protein n=1 Tax=Prauserella aidingensis TaxID=387890 RepID=UPI0020A55AD6|nr:hypothetical protein [Prauserella aidingensis]
MYKRSPPAPKCVQDLKLMMAAATAVHGPCIARETGWWDALTFVPSGNHPGPTHPVVNLARQVVTPDKAPTRILLEPGPGYEEPPDRTPRQDRFRLSDTFEGAVSGGHVLVVDDTWVSGDKGQSAALTLKAAGASTVTVLCVARWLRADWPDHEELITKLEQPYDPLCCPVSGGTCD